jgi:hypothetical protein
MVDLGWQYWVVHWWHFLHWWSLWPDHPILGLGRLDMLWWLVRMLAMGDERYQWRLYRRSRLHSWSLWRSNWVLWLGYFHMPTKRRLYAMGDWGCWSVLSWHILYRCDLHSHPIIQLGPWYLRWWSLLLSLVVSKCSFKLRRHSQLYRCSLWPCHRVVWLASRNMQALSRLLAMGVRKRIWRLCLGRNLDRRSLWWVFSDLWLDLRYMHWPLCSRWSLLLGLGGRD